MATNYKKITTVNEVTQLSAGATVFVNDNGSLKHARLALITGGTTAGTDSTALHFKGLLGALPVDTTSYKNGDVILVGSNEYVFYNNAWYEFGDAVAIENNQRAIENLSDDIAELKEIVEPASGTSLLARIESLETSSNTYVKQIYLNGVAQSTVNGTVDLTIAGGNGLQSSDEITVNGDTLEIGEVDITKIVQSAGTELIFDAGTSV